MKGEMEDQGKIKGKRKDHGRNGGYKGIMNNGGITGKMEDTEVSWQNGGMDHGQKGEYERNEGMDHNEMEDMRSRNRRNGSWAKGRIWTKRRNGS